MKGTAGTDGSLIYSGGSPHSHPSLILLSSSRRDRPEAGAEDRRRDGSERRERTTRRRAEDPTDGRGKEVVSRPVRLVHRPPSLRSFTRLTSVGRSSRSSRVASRLRRASGGRSERSEQSPTHAVREVPTDTAAVRLGKVLR